MFSAVSSRRLLPPTLRLSHGDPVSMARTALFLLLLVLASVAYAWGSSDKALLGSWRTPDHELSLTDVKFTFTIYTFRSNGVVQKTTYGKHSRLDSQPSV